MSRFEPGERVTWLSLGLNILLGAAKCGIGFAAQSRALIADGLHSFSDVATDLAVLGGFRYASMPTDANHPYGHHKITNLVSLFIGGMIGTFCLILIGGGVLALRSEAPTPPSPVALGAALVALALKEWLFHQTRSTARRIQSRMLMMNAWHHRTDSISSVLAALGIAVALIGGPTWAFVDTLAGVLLGGYLAVEAGRLIWRSLSDLMDVAPDAAILDDLREHVLPTPGVVAYHAFRARRMGDCIDVDLHLLVDPHIAVVEGHRIAGEVKQNIMNTHPEVLNVLVHVEPYLPEHFQNKGISGSNLPRSPYENGGGAGGED